MSATVNQVEGKRKPVSTPRQRRAPAGGYDFPAKAEFRRWVWDRIGGLNEATGETWTGDVLLMPSIEAREVTDEALPRGFRPNQLHVADKNPAIVASLQRRFPGIKTYGCLVDQACGRMARRGAKLIAANIDLCSQLTLETLRSIRTIANSSACESASLFITVLRGREEKFLQSIVASGSGNTGWDSYMARQVEAAFLENKDGIFWDTTTGVSQTVNDLWRIRAIHKVSERRWAQARAYVSVNNQSFLTVWLLPKDCRQPEIDEDARAMMAQTERLRVLANGGDPGDPLPAKSPGEKATHYRNRLDDRQRLRLHLISERMGISEASAINNYIDTGEAE